MYSLLSGFWRLLCTKPTYRLLIIGLDNAGKTTLLEQLRHIYAKGEDPLKLNIAPTVGLNIGRFELPGANLMMWDLGGQEGLRVLWDKYYAEAHAVIYVLDTADEKKFSQASKEIKHLLDSESLAEAPLLVLANKQDLKSIPAGELLRQLDLSVKDQYIEGPDGKKRLFGLLPVSALSGVGAKDAIEWLLEILPDSVRTLNLQHENGVLM